MILYFTTDISDAPCAPVCTAACAREINARGYEHTRQENFVFPSRTIRVPQRGKNNPPGERGEERERERPPRAVHQPNFYFTILSPPSDESYCAPQLLLLFFHSRPFLPIFFFYLCRPASKHAINTVSFSTTPGASSFVSTCILAPMVFLSPPLVPIKREKPLARASCWFTSFRASCIHDIHTHARARIHINHIRKHPIRKQYVHRFVNSIIFIGAHRETMYLCILLEGRPSSFERPVRSERARIRWRSITFVSLFFFFC